MRAATSLHPSQDSARAIDVWRTRYHRVQGERDRAIQALLAEAATIQELRAEVRRLQAALAVVRDA
jgi:hypothetical protein